MKLFSLKDKLVLEAYVDKGLETVRTTGFALVQAKVKTVPLKVLVDAQLSDGAIVKAGTIAHIPEEFAKTSPIAKKQLESDAISGKFFVVDAKEVSFFEIKHDEDVV